MVFTNMIQWLLYTRFVHFVHKTIFSNSNSILDNNPDFSECTSVSAKKKRKMLRSKDFGYFFSKDRDSSIQRGKIKLISETSLYYIKEEIIVPDLKFKCHCPFSHGPVPRLYAYSFTNCLSFY